MDQEKLPAAIGRRDWGEAKKLISNEVVFAQSVTCPPPDCRRRLAEFVKEGFNLPIFPMGTQEARKRVVELAISL